MRALSLSQPWAHIVVHGPKRIENRPLALHAGAAKMVGQRIAIHAAKSWDEDAATRLCMRGYDVPEREHLAAGAVIGVATVGQVFMYRWAMAERHAGRPQPIVDLQLDWAFGPLCILLEDVRALPEPLPCRGMLGFWTLPESIEIVMAAQLAVARG